MSMSASLRHRPFVVVASVLVFMVPLALGCGGKRVAKVSGSVTLDGKPLPAGTITFHGAKGKSASGPVNDGQYALTDVPTGDAKVTVDTYALQGEANMLSQAQQNTNMTMRGGGDIAGMPEEARRAMERDKQTAAEAQQKAKELKAKYRKVPDKYAREESTPLSFPVKSGSNTIDVPLSSK